MKLIEFERFGSSIYFMIKDVCTSWVASILNIATWINISNFYISLKEQFLSDF